MNTKELNSIATWMKANKLAVNIKETNKYTIFKPRQKKLSSNVQLFFHDEQLEQNWKGEYIHENHT